MNELSNLSDDDLKAELHRRELLKVTSEKIGDFFSSLMFSKAMNSLGYLSPTIKELALLGLKSLNE